MIIWDKGFTRPVEEHPPEEDEDEDEDIVFSSSFVLDPLEDIEEDEDIVFSSFPCVDALEDIEEPIKDEQKSSKGFGKQ